MRFGLGNLDGMRGGFLGMMVIGWLIGIVVLALMILGIIALIRYLQKDNIRMNRPSTAPVSAMPVNNASPLSNASNASNAFAILDERFARGEIDQEEYAAKKAELRK